MLIADSLSLSQKALQLLEYLIKHGSERVVDDARSHLATIKILRNFHYIDEKGKDQGINVRNRAKELSEMLSDVDRIRQERRKARANKTKYTGGGNNEFVPGSGTGRYGGFGSDSFHATGGLGAGSGGGGRSSYGGDAPAARESFEEYDAGDYEEAPTERPKPSSSTVRGGSGSISRASKSTTAPSKKQEAKVADLFSFDDDDDQQPAASAPTPAPAAAPIDAFGDDFDDFQGAPAVFAAPSKVTPTTTTSAPLSKPAQFDFLGSTGSNTIAPSKPTSKPTPSATSPPTTQSARPAAATNTSFNFDDLWASSSGKSSTAGKQKMSMAELAKDQSSSALFGAAKQPPAYTSSGNATHNSVNNGKKQDIFDLL